MLRRQLLLGLAGGGLAWAAPPPSLASRLAARTVADDDFHRRDLYSWTTVDGIANLRARPQLLVATAKTGGFLSPFLQLLTTTAARTGPEARLAQLLLTHPALLRRRYAWTAPFATVMGMGKRTYGTSLVRIELRAEAWIARFAIGDEIRIVDARGSTVSHAEVAKTPERLGAVFHVYAERPAFREYVVISDAMVERWSIATPQIRAVVDDERALLRDVREAGLSSAQADRAAAPGWRRTPTGDVAELWRATLAFDNDRYRARPAQLAAVIDALAAYDPAGAPLAYPP